MTQPITVIEIENKEFSTSMRGFNPAEVKAYLGKVAGEIETLQRENRGLKERVALLERESSRLVAQEDRVKETLLMAQKAADDARSAARHEASLIIREAETERVSVASETERLRADQAALVSQVRSNFAAFLERLEPEMPERQAG